MIGGSTAVGSIDRRDRVAPARPLVARLAEDPVQEAVRHVVEHDRDDDLVGSRPGLEEARDEAPEGAAEEAGRRRRAAGG